MQTGQIGLSGLCRLSFLAATLIFASQLVADDASSSTIEITKADPEYSKVTIDGKLDEAIWKNLPSKDDMVIIEPDTLVDAPFETKTYMFYDEKGLYVGVFAEQPKETQVARLSSRDKFITRDGISFTLDPTGEGLYGYWFSVNLGGTLQDGTVIPERQFTSQWDGPWYGASAEVENGYTVEMFIPWSLMSMPGSDADVRKMSYYISRFVAHKNERWAFPGLPPTKSVFLSELQPISFKDINPKQQFTFYPYASGTYNNAELDHKDSYKTGFDVFWRPTSNLQVAATVNPDFGNVESDNVVVNLSAFETFFPEKRAFFLEGQEIFVTSPRARQGRGGRGAPTTLVNTRRIGSSPNTPSLAGFELDDVEANQPSELIAAAKTTGQNGKLRYGVLMASENDTKLEGTLNGVAHDIIQTGRDFGIGRVLYEDTSGGARRGLGFISTQVSHESGDATVHGVDGHYLTSNGKWKTDAQLIYSDVRGESGQGGFFDISYSPERGHKHKLEFDYYDDKLDFNDLGFFRRNDNIGARYSYTLNQSGMDNLKFRNTSFRVVQDYNTDGLVVRSGLFARQKRKFNNNHQLSLSFNYFPKRWDDRNSEGNGSYKVNHRWNPTIYYETDSSKPISVGGGIFYRGGDLKGGNTEYKTFATWRPSDRFALSTFLNYEQKHNWLLHASNRNFTGYHAEIWKPKVEMDIFLSARQQFRITAQWAGIKASETERYQVPIGDGKLLDDPAAVTGSRDFSISRLTFQARYKWELAPLSDLFVVYTRGSNVASMPDSEFTELLKDSWTDALVDVFVVKLRYRLGS